MTPLQSQGYTLLSHAAKMSGGPMKYMKEHDSGLFWSKALGSLVIILGVGFISEKIKEKKHRELLQSYIESEYESIEEGDQNDYRKLYQRA